ncbi:MAG: hypothetical protein HYS13_17365 [Planctomycetia bacterium]|nr:hypothetical protein [Planctomycetia bacterium]
MARGIRELNVDGPVLSSAGVKYEFSDKARGLVCGGIGAFHRLAHKVGLVAAIDRHTRW